MYFDTKLIPDTGAALDVMGYQNECADPLTVEKLSEAAQSLIQAANPRWLYRRFPLAEGRILVGTGLVLQGRSIERHLNGCNACLVMALTLGDEVERAIRVAEILDMAKAVLLDTLASNLTEQYADAAEEILVDQAKKEGEFLTSRFSPGYGDLPIAHQREILALLDAPRSMGLSVSASGILLPRKSVTAIIGVAEHLVTGNLAGCNECALRDKCSHDKPCGKSPREQ